MIRQSIVLKQQQLVGQNWILSSARLPARAALRFWCAQRLLDEVWIELELSLSSQFQWSYSDEASTNYIASELSEELNNGRL